MTVFAVNCSQVFLDMSKKWKTGAELSASFTVEVGNLDEAGQLLHLCLLHVEWHPYLVFF